MDDFVTRTVGKALTDQRPFWNLSGRNQWVFSSIILLAHIGALTALVWGLEKPSWRDALIIPAILVGMISLTGRFRVQAVMFAHHFVHRTGASAKFDFWAAHIATALALGPNPVDYEDEHVGRHHARRHFSSVTDPDAAFILRLGFRPGMSRRALYLQLWKSIFSLRFHGLFARSRIESALLRASWTHRAFVLSWLTLLGLLAVLIPWWVFLIVIFLPLGPLYQISVLLQLLTEHRWMVTSTGPVDRHDYAERCIGRFCLVEPPPAGLDLPRGLCAWMIWGLRMIPLILVRLGVWVGDLPAHDWHHVAGMIRHAPRNWPRALFERQRAIDDGDAYGLGMREAFDLKEALDWMFDGLASAKL